MSVVIGLLLPLLGTAVGAACVFFLRKQISPNIQRMFAGFAAGVMMAASVWSLIIPAMNMSEDMGRLAFVPALVGFLMGIFFLLFIDSVFPHLHVGSDEPEGRKSGFGRTSMMILVVTIHNFPEGAIISLPLRSEGHIRVKAFTLGALSGIVEPLGAIAAILLAGLVTPILPYLLSFAAGAMIYVVVEELIPEASEGEHSNLGTIAFAVGFALMMMLDVALS